MQSQRIAVAGGTGGIGQHVVEGLLEIKAKCSLHIIVLSRSVRSDIFFAGSSAPVLAVDYNDIANLAKVLNEHQIDTVLSTLSSPDPAVFAATQGNLLSAALRVPTVHRFSPSEYTHDSSALAEIIPYARSKIEILEPLKQIKAMRGSNFEFTLFHTGAFMNYLAVGNPKPDGAKALGHITPFPYVFDFKNLKANVPGDGERRMVFTATEDIGKFVAAATQLATWEEHSEMKGDWVTFNQIISMAESILGGNILFSQKRSMPSTIVTAGIGGSPPSFTNLYLFIYLAIINGNYEMMRPFNLNEAVGNAVKPITVKEFLERWWGL
ncbi:hypothetical protein BDP27DRAFT_1208967 [Rhodocollybia butyracea]|uniref:NmrA-like domain-containing protein n=1 Tax=Rhodocollybia butyracea TaxID=206335 RepID=A0A9P5Q2Z0_9AGAR|nr:hypothetical protein BDP27DRAFT_1208967 [Rhodocollybia butyracea]